MLRVASRARLRRRPSDSHRGPVLHELDRAGVPARRLSLPAPLLAAAVAAIGALPILFTPGAGTDLSAQVARGVFAAAHLGSAYDFSWYGGVYPGAYSLLSPYVFAAIGTRVTAGFATVAAAALGGSAFAAAGIRRPRTGAVWVALALDANLFAGRATFALGLAFAALAVRLLVAPARDRPLAWALAGCGLLTTAASPVAGLFLGVLATALLLTGRRLPGLALGVGTAVPLAVSGALFPEWGTQPMDLLLNVICPVGGAMLVALLVRNRVVRVSCAIYAAGVVVAYLVATPVGSNAERLALLFAAPVIAAVATRPRAAVLAALAVLLAWQAHQPWLDAENGASPVAAGSFSAPLLAELRALHADRARVEAVPTVDHWESAVLAQQVPLARGWERQLDVARDPLFYRSRLTASGYRRWLVDNAVGYVALSDQPPDWAAGTEAQLIGTGLPYLVPVWRGAHWRLYRVLGARPLVSSPGRVESSTPAQVVLSVPAAGRYLLRVRYSPWLRASGGACLGPAGTWTSVRASAAGRVVVSAPLRLPRGSPC